MATASTRTDGSPRARQISLGRRLETLRAIRDPATKLAAATRLLDELRADERAVAAIRDAAILALASEGHSYAQIAQATRLTRGRIAQLVQRLRPPGDSD
ncbi:MAG TPA: hypothetical protein VNG13_06045 [Mycobacteriales bacterium]|nr:hypothetical protein [Mycobacteriales bacterium]